jgi:hypothetical protein
MQYRFGNIENDEITLNEYGTIAYNEWIKLTERFSYLELDVFQIMPNHMRSIIALNPVRAGFTPAQNNDEIFGQSPNGHRNDCPYIKPIMIIGRPQGSPLLIRVYPS